MAKYRKKPVVIEAVQWIGTIPSLCEIEKLMGPAEADFATDPPTIFIQTLEGKMRADRGDWIIKGVNGEFYPCKVKKQPPDLTAGEFNRREC